MQVYGVMVSEQPNVRPLRRLIIGGKSVAVPFPVIAWEDHGGLSLRDIGCADTRTDPTGSRVDLLVLHWDGCRSSHECHRVLVERGLSAHLLIDGDGAVYQTLDLAMDRAWHAKGFNDRSIGIEIQNPVQLNRRCAHEEIGRRAVTEAVAHKKHSLWTHWDFTALQKGRVVQLVGAINQLFGIPSKVPMEGERVASSLIDPTFRGVCGHYHLSPHKQDPGHSLWPLIQQTLLASDRDQEAEQPSEL